MTITQLKRKVVFYRILTVVIIALSFMWNLALLNNNHILMEEVKAWKSGCYSSCLAYDMLDSQIASGLCLPRLENK